MTHPYYEHLREEAKKYQSQKWQLKVWDRRPALYDKTERVSTCYNGQDFDPEVFHIKESAWSHDHCQFCNVTICDCDDEAFINKAYESEKHHWVCPDCYQHLIINEEDPETYLEAKWNA